jgi:hypothetical protein
VLWSSKGRKVWAYVSAAAFRDWMKCGGKKAQEKGRTSEMDANCQRCQGADVRKGSVKEVAFDLSFICLVMGNIKSYKY